MPPFPKPTFAYDYDLTDELDALHKWRDTEPGRAIPAKTADHLMLVTWNVANLGVQARSDDDYALIAEILSWFEIAAIQETNDNLAGLRAIQAHLPNEFRVLFSNPSGNRERLTFVYDSTKLSLHEEVGEIVFPPSEYPRVTLPGVDHYSFTGFDRTPYLATFTAGAFTFSLVCCHLYYGDAKPESIDRRTLETYAVAYWADERRKDPNALTTDIVPLGDFNLPMVDESDPIYHALTARGLAVPPHQTQIGTAVASDAHYDQLAFFPGDTMADFVEAGVFDFDGALFRDLWDTLGRTDFDAYTRFHISDHRPLWAEFSVRTGV